MPIIKFVNESEKIEYPTEQDVCSLLCYAFAPQKTIMNDNQFVGCKPFGFPFWYMRNPLAVHQFMEFNHKRQFKHRKDLAKHRVISFSKEENALLCRRDAAIAIDVHGVPFWLKDNERHF